LTRTRLSFGTKVCIPPWIQWPGQTSNPVPRPLPPPGHRGWFGLPGMRPRVCQLPGRPCCDPAADCFFAKAVFYKSTFRDVDMSIKFYYKTKEIIAWVSLIFVHLILFSQP
jgi:hypothetical protein